MITLDLATRADRERERQAALPRRVFCCSSASCQAVGATPLRSAIAAGLQATGAAAELVPTGCQGLCSRGPLVRVETATGDARLYAGLTPPEGQRLAADLDAPPPEVESRRLESTLPFLARQSKIVLENIDRIDPHQLDHYLARDGYQALVEVLRKWTPAEVCDEIERSGLRGRGGAGYPTGVKWKLVGKAKSSRKFVVANGDEGDPGAYMDRTVMEDDPHRLIEGLLIAAYAVGAQQGYFYVRGEYPLAIDRLKASIAAARRLRLVGRGILGTDFSCELELRIGAGAFVCGEETALIASIEGGRGTPRMRPPYPPERGIDDQPTLINNVETLANVPAIMRRSAAWFAGIGTPTSKGTKVFSLNGALVNTGLIEVPMGITLREIVYDIGGGPVPGRRIKAVQTGGPSGGCIPASEFDLPVDYESLQRAHSIMGSGGVIVVDDSTNMVEFARYFMEFCRDESCGKCVPCRVGTVHLSNLLRKLGSGGGTQQDLEQVEELCDLVKHTSLCGLGQTAPNPVISTLRHFRHEYTERLAQEAAAPLASTAGTTPRTQPTP